MFIIKVFNGTGDLYGSHMTRETFNLGPKEAQELLNRLMRSPPDFPIDPFDEAGKAVADLLHSVNMACCDEIERGEDGNDRADAD